MCRRPDPRRPHSAVPHCSAEDREVGAPGLNCRATEPRGPSASVRAEQRRCAGWRARRIRLGSFRSEPQRFLISLMLEEAPPLLVGFAPRLDLCLDPAALATRTVRRVTALGDHAFQPRPPRRWGREARNEPTRELMTGNSISTVG